MDFRLKYQVKIILLIMLFFTESSCISKVKTVVDNNTNKVGSSQIDSQRDNLKKFATCACIREVYPDFDKPFKDGSASEYLQQSDYDIAVYDSVRIFAQVWVKNHLVPNFQNHKLGLKRCLEFNGSVDLSNYVKKFDSDTTK